MRLASTLFFLLAAPLASAQELVTSLGTTRVVEAHDTTFGARVAWHQPLSRYLAASISYANEGHVPGHHRDGFAAQLWVTAPLAPHLELALGAGPYQYFDTAHAESADGFRDAHGTGVVYSIAATWRPAGSRWSWQARIDHNETRRDMDSTMLMLGVGWRLDPDAHPATPTHRSDDEIVASWGQTIVNSFESQRSSSRAIAWRRALGPLLRVSAGWINEGDARLIRRDGLVTEAWLEPQFGDWSLGMGAGAYFAVDEYREQRRHVSPVATVTFSRRLGGSWVARFDWTRVISNYDRDSDVLLLGVGYRF